MAQAHGLAVERHQHLAIEAEAAGMDLADFPGLARRQADHVAIARHHGLRHLAVLGEARMGHQMAIFPMHRHRDAGAHPLILRDQLVAGRVAVHMDGIVTLGHDLDPELGQIVLQSPDRAVIARNDTGREEHGIAGFENHGRMLAPGERLGVCDVFGAKEAYVPDSPAGYLDAFMGTMRARFADLAEVERHMRDACSTFGPLEDGQWRRLARHGSRRREDGAYTLAYDPAIVSHMRRSGNAGVEFGKDFLLGIDLWPVWDAVRCPTLVLRGEDSDLLLESTVRRMRERGPHVELVEFPGIGHAPWLMSDEQIGAVRKFLLAPEPSKSDR